MAATVAPFDWPVSSARSLMAPSIWRRLLMQAFCCEVARALMKLGMAIAANRPIMATTIIISTRVKPALREVLFVFMFYFFVFILRRERRNRRVTLIITISVHLLPVATTT